MNKNNNVKIGICQWIFPFEGPYACKVAADLGLSGIELSFDSELSQKYVQNMYLEASRQWGIAFPSLGINALCEHGLSKVSKETIVYEILDLAVEIASSMGISLLQVPSFGDGVISTEEEFQQTAKTLAYACKKAEKYLITVGTENALSAEDNYRLMKTCGYNNLKVYFDTQNPCAMKGFDSAEMIRKLHPYICESHVKDGIDGMLGNALLGNGTSCLKESLDALLEREFSGWLILENNYQEPVMKAIAQDINYIKDYLRDRGIRSI